MNVLKKLGVSLGIGLFLLSLLVCSRTPEGGYYLDPDKYKGTWTLENGTELQKLILTEDTWIYVRGDEIYANFCFYQGGTGTFEITPTTINLHIDKVFACTDSESCDWYAKETSVYNDKVVSSQKTVSYSLTDTKLTVDMGSGPEEFTKQ